MPGRAAHSVLATGVRASDESRIDRTHSQALEPNRLNRLLAQCRRDRWRRPTRRRMRSRPRVDPAQHRGPLVIGEVNTAGFFQKRINLRKRLLIGKQHLFLKVLYYHKTQSAVSWHAPEKLLQRLQASCRSPDSDNQRILFLIQSCHPKAPPSISFAFSISFRRR